MQEAKIGDTRTYFVPLEPFTFNELYTVAQYGRRRMVLRPEFVDYKKLCAKFFLLSDVIQNGNQISDLDLLRGEPPKNFVPWATTDWMYDADCYFCFPRDRILTKKNNKPFKAKDTDSVLKLSLDALFDYFGLGDQYVRFVSGYKLVSNENIGGDFFFSKKHRNSKGYSFLTTLTRVPRDIPECETLNGFNEALKVSHWKEITQRMESISYL